MSGFVSVWTKPDRRARIRKRTLTFFFLKRELHARVASLLAGGSPPLNRFLNNLQTVPAHEFGVAMFIVSLRMYFLNNAFYVDDISVQRMVRADGLPGLWLMLSTSWKNKSDTCSIQYHQICSKRLGYSKISRFRSFVLHSGI